MHASREGLREAHVEGPKPSPNVWAGGGLAPSPVRVEEPEQRQTTAQKASYAALFRNMCASGGGNACKPGGAEMSMLKTHLVQDLVSAVEPTIRTKVAWARPECAGRNTNSKSTCEVQALRTVKAEERGLASPFQRRMGCREKGETSVCRFLTSGAVHVDAKSL